MIVCAWCKCVVKDGEEPASHGVCPECKQLMLNELQLNDK